MYFANCTLENAVSITRHKNLIGLSARSERTAGLKSVMPKYGRDIWLVNAKSTNNSGGNMIC